MARARRKHSVEFKREAVRLSREPGRKVGEVAANLGIDRGLLQRWRSEMEAHGASAFPGNGRPKASDEENRGRSTCRGRALIPLLPPQQGGTLPPLGPSFRGRLARSSP
jgi:transposase